MSLLFLCLVFGEIGFSIFCYYGQTTYNDISRAWTGLIYAGLPVLLTFVEPKGNLFFQKLVMEKLCESNLLYKNIQFSGGQVAFACCMEEKDLYIITPDENDKTTVLLQKLPIKEVSKIIFGETIAGWKIEINDELSYQVRQTEVFAYKLIQWEEFFKQMNVPANVTYLDNSGYWISHFLGVTLSIFVVLIMLFLL